MKKIFVILLTVCSGFSLSAQDSLKTKYRIEKGTKLITGSLSFGGSGGQWVNQGSGQLTNLTFTINETSGFFVAPNLVVGKTLGYGLDYSRIFEFNGATQDFDLVLRKFNHSISPGVFLRYYKMFTPKFGIMGQFMTTVPFYIMVDKHTPVMAPAYSTKQHNWGLNASISPRLVYFFTRRLAMEAGFGSLSFAYFRNPDIPSNSFLGGFNLNPNLSFGLSVYLGKGVQPYRKN